MIGLLLAACLTMPIFEIGDPIPCLEERQKESCGCSECIEFDVATDVEWVEVNRETVSDSTFRTVASIPAVSPCEDCPPRVFAHYCPAKDSAFPHDGTLYRYRFRGCRSSGCLEWDEPGVYYRGAPYACFENGKEKACYVGAPLRLKPRSLRSVSLN